MIFKSTQSFEIIRVVDQVCFDLCIIPILIFCQRRCNLVNILSCVCSLIA